MITVAETYPGPNDALKNQQMSYECDIQILSQRHQNEPFWGVTTFSAVNK
jgi:hypothetical protein